MDEPFFRRIDKPVGLQLYALGEDAGKDLGATFAAVRAMGYGEVELPNLYGRSATDVAALSAGAGLPIASLHVPAVPFAPSDTLTFGSDPDEISRIAHTLGAGDVVIPFPILPEGFSIGRGEDFPTAIARAFAGADADHWRRAAERFNEIGATMTARGLRLAYHNHNIEFAPLGDITPWEILLAETDPRLVRFQVDLGWVAQAGRDPIAVLEQLSGRVASVHVKDIAQGSAPTLAFGMKPAEVGAGVLDWSRILPAADAAGARHYFVEQEPPFTIPRIEAAARSLAFLQSLRA